MRLIHTTGRALHDRLGPAIEMRLGLNTKGGDAERPSGGSEQR